MNTHKPYALYETCCGSAAFTYHMLGARRALLPYQGSKWKHRRALTAIAERLGFVGPPTFVRLFDVSPWGIVATALLDPDIRKQVVFELSRLADEDPRAVFDRLQGGRAEQPYVIGHRPNWSRFYAEFLFLQRLSFSGKAVGIRNGCWSSPGFNKSSAYGLPATERFGAVSPMVPSMIRTLQSYDGQVRVPSSFNAPEGCRTLVYIDPPYQGSTKYPDGDVPRETVIDMALVHQADGATVMVSEAEPIPELVDQGWQTEQISAGREDSSPFRGQQEEWVTWRSGARTPKAK